MSERYIVTCAHVVSFAHENSSNNITLQSANGEYYQAQVVADFWRAENAEDVAVLQLAQPTKSIEPLLLGASVDTNGHRFSSFGFPRDGQELVASGEILGYAGINDIKLLQLRSPEVTPGFSGGPVFDEYTRCVVGMVVSIAPTDEYQRLGTTGFAVPSETILNICPRLFFSENTKDERIPSLEILKDKNQLLNVDPVKLRKVMHKAFDRYEFERFLKDNLLDYHDLPEGPLENKIMYCIDWFRRRQSYDRLVAQVLTEHPELIVDLF